jgi:leader peptidase (prepilin peptidase)/N-methyltransferase
MIDLTSWALVPFHFWSVVFFFLGSIVGSFLNVCVHRLPHGLSLVSPPSHCPHCEARIPWHCNVPLASWLWLRGRCRACGAPISPRYVVIELLTGLLFLGCWLTYGRISAALALIYCLMLAGLVVATFIDLEHFIIPDTITLGGIGAGFVCSLLVPELHRAASLVEALRQCLVGAALGGGVIYAIVRIGKLFLGRQKFPLPPGSRVYFTEEHLVLPTMQIPYGEVLYRRTDAIRLTAREVELVDRCYWNVPVQLTRESLRIGEVVFRPEDVTCLEAVTDAVVIPREAMGLGDVKFMAAIGAFLGWQGMLFSLMGSALVGSIAGLTLIALHRHSRANPIPYGPYLALAAAVWVFAGDRLSAWIGM